VRVYLALLMLVATAVLVSVAWLAPVKADASGQAVKLPETHFASTQSGHGFSAPPGFADAVPARNLAHPDAKAVGQQVCTACHSQESGNFAHTAHAAGMQVALAANPATATCEACHGPGSVHAANPTQKGAIIAFSHKGGHRWPTRPKAAWGAMPVARATPGWARSTSATTCRAAIATTRCRSSRPKA